MIGTVAGMAATSGIKENLIRCRLAVWVKQGRARNTGRTVLQRDGLPGRETLILWEVRDRVWHDYLARYRTRRDCPGYLLLSSADYLRAVTERYHARTRHIKRAYRKLQAEAYARRHPFVGLE